MTEVEVKAPEPTRLAIFHCPKDDCWIVCKWHPARRLYIGAAECPDERTARKVLEALQLAQVAR
ncbi:hypothetical protein LCGC14_2434640 [marine sediment metagenome]|uniref:Uncharacterized protein n=1 Tax=marine sediment metagenome TaxID=412755 RepID=A0A0F9EET9_9ZZZZ